MLLSRQLELTLDPPTIERPPRDGRAAVALSWPRGRDYDRETIARELLRPWDAAEIANKICVEWNTRLRTCAGRANSARSLISLNPRLQEHGAAEIDRTFRHELAHLLAQFRAGRRRIPPHGSLWRQACCDLGIADERRCHTLPFPVQRHRRRYPYKCPKCGQDFPRVRRIRRVTACLACCRKHNGGKFDTRFRLQLLTS